jgi:hypothetical protein
VANIPPFTVIVILTVAEPSLSDIATEPSSRTLSPGRARVKSMVSVVVVPLSTTMTVSCTVTAGVLRLKRRVSETEEVETDAVKFELLREPLKV